MNKLNLYIQMIGNYIEQYRNILVAFIFLIFAGLALYQYSRSPDFLFIILLARDIFVALFMLIRKDSVFTERGIYTPITIASLVSPILYIKTSDHMMSEEVFLAFEIMRYFGIGLVTLATINLGKSFGIRPAFRGNRVNWGLYRIFPHPMYLGYAIFQAAYLFVDWKNFFVFGLAMTLFYLRATRETEILNQYSK